MKTLTEKVTKGKNKWAVRVTWSIDGTPVVWADANTAEEAREECELSAIKHGILNRPAR